MKKYLVLLSAVAAAFVVTAAQAQDSSRSTTGKGSDVLGSTKKEPAAVGPDASKPESKLGSNAKPKVRKTPPGTDGAEPGPYGVGLKKVPPRSKADKPDSASDASAK